MFISCFTSILWGAGLSVAFCLLGTLLAWFQGPGQAEAFFKTFVYQFNGILVGATSFGLVHFVRAWGGCLFSQLKEVLVLSPSQEAEIKKYHTKSISPFWLNLVSIPITAVGTVVFSKCGFPLSGYAKIYLAFCVNSIWYAASTALAFFIFSVFMFDVVDRYSATTCSPRIAMRHEASWGREILADFFIISPAMGLAAIYFGFRAALTGFNIEEKSHPLLHSLLLLPVILYLPVSLLYSFHPRYVLRQVFERDVMLKFDALEKQIDISDKRSYQEQLNASKLIYEVKEKLLSENKGSQLLGVKDAPSLTLALLLLIQFFKDDLMKVFAK